MKHILTVLFETYFNCTFLQIYYHIHAKGNIKICILGWGIRVLKLQVGQFDNVIDKSCHPAFLEHPITIFAIKRQFCFTLLFSLQKSTVTIRKWTRQLVQQL
jgi:hypothetical protein